jgi:hypothetical protein
VDVRLAGVNKLGRSLLIAGAEAPEQLVEIEDLRQAIFSEESVE